MLAEGSVRLQEIAENLHRADLTTLQRNEQIAEGIRPTEEKHAAEGVSGQFAPKPRGGRPSGRIAAAAREFGVENVPLRRLDRERSEPHFPFEPGIAIRDSFRPLYPHVTHGEATAL